MKPLSRDTSPAADAILVEACRRMTTAQKVKRIRDLHATANALAASRIRTWYGDVSDREMNLRLAALRLDRDTTIRFFDWDPEEKGY